MCLAVPGRVTAVYDAGGLTMGRVDFGGAAKEVCLAYLCDPAVGEFVVVHAGFAISKLDEAVAERTLRELAALDPGGAGP